MVQGGGKMVHFIGVTLVQYKSAGRRTDLDKCFWYRGTHSRKFSRTMDDQCVQLETEICAAALLSSLPEILLLCFANLHNLVKAQKFNCLNGTL